ncbi:glycoside hydrolase family 3 protein [Alkalimonas amylolytica]|uniref:beta-N-acetylhexosaminidase n=1 Tax=Alkalimonas amylolytica TaxID=152573 RepID=A0A1H4CL59_ALKAM|nr:glycoside hydrolase family 3 protein [Alkalimonas amylolytica]SEA61069.1 beta-N-acetylhexosaminidase [Alkalimonas amylolytica]
MRLIKWAAMILATGWLAWSGPVLAQRSEPLPIRTVLAQKIMLDLRYYCQDPVPAGHCRAPLTELPAELAQLIASTELGGVIHFAENLQDIRQIYRLNQQLQHAASRSKHRLPLFIAVDQEGGRVARLPKHQATTFSGNMAIGATYQAHGVRYANQVAQVQAKELLALGFNLNFAPTVDVNNNPANPVINVRAFGDEPSKVAELGAAMVAGMQQQGLLSALKHFPGHGDTEVDSHLGLPLVRHSKERITAVELAPFAHIIEQQPPAMIMTAHIQFPALDSSTLQGRDGRSFMKPATLSRAILTELLRRQLGYQGVIVTDALDMKGISDFFTAEQAVIHAFAAGADIALMPVKIQSPAELQQLDMLLDALEQAVASGKLDESELRASQARIQALKQQLPTQQPALSLLAHPEHKALEQALARNSITLLRNRNQLLPLQQTPGQRWFLLMPDSSRCQALMTALQARVSAAVHLSCGSLLSRDWPEVLAQLQQSTLLISAFVTPMQSVAELGGMDDVAALGGLQQAFAQQQQRLQAAIRQAGQQQLPHVYLSLRSPYDVATFGQQAQAVLASYDYHTVVQPGSKQHSGPAFEALADVLLGLYPASGVLPVQLPEPVLP